MAAPHRSAASARSLWLIRQLRDHSTSTAARCDAYGIASQIRSASIQSPG
ncbi:hypothetical protein PXO_03617 [Xanthomonas oryzae pv. oryzae PXO99A]|uniref:Uncharacterized protein n=1 Tax=Xanthomonas oryzae pv. oryzae (strain PXO99A) TaxID=360094 RepID=A0A0K0GFF8_XANOP|nr:hypothetical protein PXO_03617 [Xanthomonas oryzae pv. oryzae PXO99A]